MIGHSFLPARPLRRAAPVHSREPLATAAAYHILAVDMTDEIGISNV